MYLWKTSIGGLKYYLARFPDSNFYTSTTPVNSQLEARAEAALGISILLQHQAVLFGIWNGVKSLEPQVARRLRGAKGVLIVALISEANIVNPDVQVPQKMYQTAWIGEAGSSYRSAVNIYESKSKLLPGSPANWHNTYAYIWATKE